MADLGTIDYINVNQGTRVVDRSLETRAIGQGLDIAKKTLDEGIKASVANDIVDVIDQQAMAQAEATQNVPEPVYEKGSEEEYLASRINRLNAIREQGSRSQQTLAEMEIQKVLTAAQAKYPWIADDLRARAGAVVAGSATMTAIGLHDEMAEAAAKTAQSELDAIVDHARKAWKDGGLGIPTSLSPTDPEFQRLYAENSRRRFEQQTQEMKTGMALSHGADLFNNPASMADIESALIGKYSLLDSSVQEIYQAEGLYELQLELARGENGNSVFIDSWRNGGNAQRIEQRLLEMYDEYVELVNTKIPMESREDPRAKQFLKLVDDTKFYIESQIQMIRGVQEGIPGAAQQMDRLVAIRQGVQYSQLTEPTKNALAFLQGPGGQLLNAAATARNTEGIILLDRFSLSAQTYLADSYPELFTRPVPGRPTPESQDAAKFYNSSSALELSPQADKETVLATVRARLQDPNQSWTLPTRNGEEELIAALNTAETAFAIWYNAKDIVEKAGPIHADNTLLSLTYSLEALNGSLQNPVNIQEQLGRMMADDSLMQAVELSLGQGPSGVRNAFAESAGAYYNGTQPDVARNAAGTKFREELIDGQVTLAEVVELDLDAINKGTFKYTINMDNLKPLIQRKSIVGGRGKPINRETGERRAVDAVHQEMSKIIAVMNQQIRIERMLNKARSTDGVVFQQADTWQDHFYGNGNVIPGAAWANQFIVEE